MRKKVIAFIILFYPFTFFPFEFKRKKGQIYFYEIIEKILYLDFIKPDNHTQNYIF